MKKDKLFKSGIDIVDKMSREEFERFLLVHFENLGYKGKLTPLTNDYGADLILSREEEKIVVQAKRWNQKVGIEAIQQVIGAIGYYNAQKGIVVTNSYFTPNAYKLAKVNNIELWDRNKLIEIMSHANGRDMANRSIIKANAEERICPSCNNKLVLRNGKNGQFYGCSNYPNCRYTEKTYKI